MNNQRSPYFQDPHHRLLNSRNTTVKKEFSNKSAGLNQRKENIQNSSNFMINRQKHTIRKNNQINQNQQTQQKVQFCTNHPDRTSQYIVNIDEQILNYCRKCATHIASQGFDVHKIITSPIDKLRRNIYLPNNHIQNQLQFTNLPTQNNHSFSRKSNATNQQKHNQLVQMINSLNNLKSQYKIKSDTLTAISSTFSFQKQTLLRYYRDLITHIQQIRDSHIQAIEESSSNTIQVCQIEKGQILQTVEQIDQMINDIQTNLDSILISTDQQSYIECYEFYKQKEGIFGHRLEQIGSEAKPWPCTSEKQITGKIASFKAFVNELHQVNDDLHQVGEGLAQIDQTQLSIYSKNNEPFQST